MKKVLIVDDEKALRSALKDKLSQDEYDLLEASSGKECMKILETESVDLVILDIMMPGMSGDEVAKQIYESDKLKSKPAVIILTNKSDMELMADIVASAHSFKYLIKSDSTLDKIAGTVKETIGQG